MTYDCLMDYPSMLNLFSHFCNHFYHRRRKTGKLKKKVIAYSYEWFGVQKLPFFEKYALKIALSTDCMKAISLI